MARISLGVRESRPDLHNFRDAGRMVDGPLLSLLSSLQRKTGAACISERGLRILVHEDTGLCPGVSTIPKALRRLEPRGILTFRWVRRGQRLHDGRYAQVGMMEIRLAVNRLEKRINASNFAEGINPHRVPMPGGGAGALLDALNRAADRIDQQTSMREKAAEWQSRECSALLSQLASDMKRRGPPS